MDRTLDLESGSNKPVPGMWRFPTNPDLCCIYRVPERLRRVNPEAYTPQLVLIGPLHHSLKSQALKRRGDITNGKLMGYLNMEEHKKIYLSEFTKRIEGKKPIEGFRRIVEEDEEIIRASYSESTAWIRSQEFVEMILYDAVFILEFILRSSQRGPNKIGDHLMDEPCLLNTITEDLILLENQLPYFLLEKLFDLIVLRLHPNQQTLRKLVITHFLLDKKIRDNQKFRHFTDLLRCVRVETLPKHGIGVFKPIEEMYNAEKLRNGGVRFEGVSDELSINVRFENGLLKIPYFMADDDVEITIRNIMAFEQCHYPYNAHVCNYVMFLDYLIDTEKDVDLLVKKGIIKNWIGGHPASVAKMVNNLCLGVADFGSYYSHIASEVIHHYRDSYNKSRAVLKHVYFNNPWTGTATVAATLLLLLTLCQAVTSIIQVLPKKPSH